VFLKGALRQSCRICLITTLNKSRHFWCSVWKTKRW